MANEMDRQIAVLQTRLEDMDRHYASRIEALKEQFALSLSAMDKATSAAFAASEKAIVKAENAQREYNQRSNEFRGALDDQNKIMNLTMMSRQEWETTQRASTAKVDVMREDLSEKADQKSVVALSRVVHIGLGMAMLLSFLVPVLIAVFKTK